MPDERTLLLQPAKIQQKLERIAYEILEDNYDEEEIILAGVKERGLIVAKKLATFIKGIMSVKVNVIHIDINEEDPTKTSLSKDIAGIVNGKVLIIVDDVANSGRTLLYATKPFLDHLPKKIQVAVLVDRRHKRYPIAADYVGLSLATTIQEHISMEVDGEKITSVYLQ